MPVVDVDMKNVAWGRQVDLTADGVAVDFGRSVTRFSVNNPSGGASLFFGEDAAILTDSDAVRETKYIKVRAGQSFPYDNPNNPVKKIWIIAEAAAAKAGVTVSKI